MRGVRLCLHWPFRDERAELAARFARTLDALEPLGLTVFREGPRVFDRAGAFDVPPSLFTKRIHLTGLQHGRPRGAVHAQLRLRPERDPCTTSDLSIEHAG